MRREYFTMNPAYPHPDDDREPQPWPLADAVRLAVKVLQNPTADQHTRNFAAAILEQAHEEEQRS